MVTAREIVDGSVSLLGLQDKIQKVEFNSPDGNRVGVVEIVWPGDNIIVKSWPKGSNFTGDMQRYQLQCTNYAMGGEFPPNQFWSPCTMLPTNHNAQDGRSTYSMAPGGSITEGIIVFTLQPSKKEANTNFGILVAAIGALIFLI